MRKMQFCIAIALLTLTAVGQSGAKSKIDLYPKGTSTAEGVACDLARAFIKADKKLLNACVLDPSEIGREDDYRKFLKQIGKDMDAEKKRAKPSPNGPTEIITCYEVRSFTKSGPVSAGYALFGFEDVRFVDVRVKLAKGSTALNRTLVIQTKDKKWHAMPRPDLIATVSSGLSDEPASTKVWKPARK